MPRSSICKRAAALLAVIVGAGAACGGYGDRSNYTGPAGLVGPGTVRVTLAPDSLNLAVGDARAFSVTTSDGTLLSQLEWVLSDSTVVSVTSSRVLTALAVGTSTVTVRKRADTTISASSHVIVRQQ